jgi:hypothetical protein
MDAATGAVIMTGLATVGKPGAELLRDFLGRILAPTGEALGTALAHPVLEWQKRRVGKGNEVLLAAAQKVQEAGVDAHAVPGRLLMPILEKSSLEDDPDLTERWSTLLANAAMAPGAILPSFVTILGELSPLGAAPK